MYESLKAVDAGEPELPALHPGERHLLLVAALGWLLIKTQYGKAKG